MDIAVIGADEIVRGIPAVRAREVGEWRAWLETHSDVVPRVWLVMFSAGGGEPTVGQAEAVEQALCFGWIDSLSIRRAAGGRYQQFGPRNPRSSWSAVNRERAERMTRLGQMRQAGLDMVSLAQDTGRWQPHPDAEQGVVPPDLADELARVPRAQEHFAAFPPSSRKQILTWIAEAKRSATRSRRIAETVRLAADNVRAHHPTWPRT